MKTSYSLLLLITIIGIFYYNTIGWLIESWLYNQYYSHGFLVPIISGYIIWNMREELIYTEKKQTDEGLFIFMGGIIVQLISIFWTIRFLSGFSLLLTIAGIIIYLYGWSVINKIKFPFLFLLFMIPLPFIDIVAGPVQTISAITTANLANLIGLNIYRDGLILINPNGSSFEVGLECSGINSIISLLTVGTIFAFVLEGEKIMKMTILISAIPLALAGNIVRITSVLVVADKYGQDMALDYFHDFSSLLLFSIALIGLFLVGRSFGRLKFKKIF